MTKPKIKTARIDDYTNYHPDKCNNGGAYSFHKIFNYVGDNKYEILYSTSAEFEYCSYCGNFGNCHCDYPDIISESELENELNFKPSERLTKEIEFFPNGWKSVLRKELKIKIANASEEQLFEISHILC